MDLLQKFLCTVVLFAQNHYQLKVVSPGDTCLKCLILITKISQKPTVTHINNLSKTALVDKNQLSWPTACLVLMKFIFVRLWGLKEKYLGYICGVLNFLFELSKLLCWIQPSVAFMGKCKMLILVYGSITIVHKNNTDNMIQTEIFIYMYTVLYIFWKELDSQQTAYKKKKKKRIMDMISTYFLNSSLQKKNQCNCPQNAGYLPAKLVNHIQTCTWLLSSFLKII